MIQIEVFTKPDCNGCEMVKKDLLENNLVNITTYKTIKGKEGIENLRYIKSKGFDNIPVIKVFNENKEEFLVGYHPIDQINNLIKKIQNFSEVR